MGPGEAGKWEPNRKKFAPYQPGEGAEEIPLTATPTLVFSLENTERES